MTTEETRALAAAMYAAYERRDFEQVADIIGEDIDWVIYAPIEVFPFVGARRGRKEVLEALAGIAEQYALERYRPELLIADGDRAAALSDVSFVQRASGRKLRFHLANFLRFRDGKLVEFREFANTFDMVEQALGRLINL